MPKRAGRGEDAAAVGAGGAGAHETGDDLTPTDPLLRLIALYEDSRREQRHRDLITSAVLLLAIGFVVWTTVGIDSRADREQRTRTYTDCVAEVFDEREALFEERLTVFLAVLLSDDIPVQDAESLPLPDIALEDLRTAGRAPTVDDLKERCGPAPDTLRRGD